MRSSIPALPMLSRRSIVRQTVRGPSQRPDPPAPLATSVDVDRAPELMENDLVARRRGSTPQRTTCIRCPRSVLGHRGAEERLDGYATAVLRRRATTSPSWPTIEDELFRFMRIVVRVRRALASALTSRDLPPRPVGRSSGTYSRAGPSRDRSPSGGLRHPGRAAPRLPRAARSTWSTGWRPSATAVWPRSAPRSRWTTTSAASWPPPSAASSAETSRSGSPWTRRCSAGFVATIGDTVVDGSARHRLEL